jgi:imidazole glycerol-phosphate synthase subunit HisF
VLKKRVVAGVIVRHGVVVQSLGFRRYLPVGRPSINVEFLNAWGADEIILLDITATREDRSITERMITDAGRHCRVPLTIGGGLRTIDDIKMALHSGADKIAINTASVKAPRLITEASRIFGRQCIVVSIDASRQANGRHEVFLDSGRAATGLDAVAHAKTSAEIGAGEILINSIDRDGSKAGFDIDLVAQISDAVPIPVIAAGGAGAPVHFLDVFRQTRASAAAAANFFQFTEHSIAKTKAALRSAGLDIRTDTYANYLEASFGPDGRLRKRPDDYLEELAYEHIPEEVI